MKRDRKLQRLILRQVLDDSAPPELKDYEEALAIYNSALLVNDRFIEGEVIRDGSGAYASVAVPPPTLPGFLRTWPS
jgi:hypothetical protein